MKKRRTIIISLLLVAAIALGVGYAAVSTELTISGKAMGAQRTDALKVNFISDTEKQKTNENIQTTHSHTDNGGSFSIDGISTGDIVSFEYKIENQETDLKVGAKLVGTPVASYKIYEGAGVTEENLVDSDHYNDYFTVVTTITNDKESRAWNNETDILMPGETATVTVTVTMIAEAVDLYTLNDYNFTMNWEAVLVPHAGE